MAKPDVAKIADQAIDQLAQAVEKGEYLTPSGKRITLDPDQHLRVLQWAAQQREKKPRVLDSPDDLELKKTTGR